MKVICDRGALMEAINLVSGAVAQRSPRVQLTCVKVVATKKDKAGELSLSATDAEIALKLTLAQVDVKEAGEALLPADKIRQIVSAEESEQTLTLETDKESMHIRGADAHFTVFGYDPKDFPAIPGFAEVLTGSASSPKAKAVMHHPAGQLSTQVTRTLFATARENTRFAYSGVLVKRDGKRVEFVATDGRRLAVSRASIGGGEKDAKPVSCIVPTKALAMLLKLLSDPEESVSIAITDNQILFSIGAGPKEGGEGRAVMVSNLVEGAFPPYEDAIPRDQDKKVTFDRDVMISAVRRAAVLTNEESRGVRLAFNGKDKQLELSSRAPEMGQAEIKVDLAGYDGENIEIGFNPNYITDALKVIDEPQVVMELKAPGKPALIKSGQDFLYVVMPVNLQ